MSFNVFSLISYPPVLQLFIVRLELIVPDEGSCYDKRYKCSKAVAMKKKS